MYFSTTVHFKRLDSRGFHDLFNHYLSFFTKHYEYCKTEAKDIWVIFSRFFKQCSFDDFHKYKIAMALYNGKKPIAQF